VYFFVFLHADEKCFHPRHLKQCFPFVTASALWVGEKSMKVWQNTRGCPGLVWHTMQVLSSLVGFGIATILTVGPNFTILAGGCGDFCALRDADALRNSSAPTIPSIHLSKLVRPDSLGRNGYANLPHSLWSSPGRALINWLTILEYDWPSSGFTLVTASFTHVDQWFYVPRREWLKCYKFLNVCVHDGLEITISLS
jgi:hypothetical protein